VQRVDVFRALIQDPLIKLLSLLQSTRLMML
jgi:hypothetical protein